MRLTRLGLVVLPLTAFACFSSDDNANPLVDAGVADTSQPDASIMDAAAPFADGMPMDTSPPSDAPADVPMDAAPLPVTVAVVGQGGPEAGMVVIVSDATGAMIAMGTTNSAGLYTSVIPAGSQVTALLGSTAAPVLVTVVGVQPGDLLTARDTPNATLSVTIPSLPANPPQGVVDYAVNPGHCGQEFEAVPETYSIESECYGSASLPMLVTALDANGDQLGFAYQKVVPLDEDAGTATASGLGAWPTTLGTQTVTLASTSQGTPNVFFNEYVATLGASGNDGFTTPADAGAPTAVFPTHPGFADFVQTEINTQDTNSLNGYTTVSAIATRTSPSATAGVVAFDPAQYLPTITLATLDGTDPARPTIAITADAALASTDGTFISFGWFQTDDGGNASAGRWVIVAPPGVSSVQTPVIPSSLGWAPYSDAGFGSPVVAMVDGDMIPSYAALRQVGLAFPAAGFADDSFDFGAIVPPLPANGTVRVSAFVQIPE